MFNIEKLKNEYLQMDNVLILHIVRHWLYIKISTYLIISK